MDEREVLKIIEEAAKDGRTTLDLRGEGLTSVPAEIGNLANLTTLVLDNNQLTSVPAEIGNLANLTELDLCNNQLTSIPAEIGKLTKLTELRPYHNQLTSLPAEIGNLANLQMLQLNKNQLTSIPAEIGKLNNLTRLWLDNNQLTSLPAEIGKLNNLEILDLNHNQLTSLPAEVGMLNNLRALRLSNNQLTSVPAEIGKLNNLTILSLDGNAQLSCPPPEVVEQGREAVLAYLRQLAKEKKLGKEERRRYEAKLLVLGDGDEGKTCVSRALRRLKFKKQTTTLGVDIEPWGFAHPDYLKDESKKITLNIWDFEGQEINHQSHQFFLTQRSLYLLVFKGREQFRRDRAEYWLDTIRSRAPGSRVVLVATECEKRTPYVPLEQLKSKYPDLLQDDECFFAVGCANKNDRGVNELRSHLQRSAADMELMGKVWLGSYTDAEKAIKQKAEDHAHINRRQLYEIFSESDIEESDFGNVANLMAVLGIITHFPACVDLEDFIVLKPQWLTKAMSYVLENKQLDDDKGEITHKRLKGLWDKSYPGLYQTFHNCMEEFELCYDLDDEPGSLVPLRFGSTPPVIPWTSIPNARERRIEYRFNVTPPAGIMSRFIVKTHYMIAKTQEMPKGIYWYNGVFLRTGEGDNRSEALCEFDNDKRVLSIQVKAAFPQNMVEQLNGFVQAVFSFFEGLKPERHYGCVKIEDKRELQCVGSHDERIIAVALGTEEKKVICAEKLHQVDAVHLVTGFSSFGKYLVSSEELTEAVREGVKQIGSDVMTLLVGVDKISDEVMVIREQGKKLPAVLGQRLELKLRDYLGMLNEMLDNREFNSAPAVVSIVAADGSGFNPGNWFNKEYVVTPYCECEKGVHKVDFSVKFKKPRQWWEKTAPKVAIGAKFLSAGLRIAFASLPIAVDPKLFEEMKNEVELMKELTGHLELQGPAQSDISDDTGRFVEKIDGPAKLRDLRGLGGDDEKRIVRMQLAQLLAEIVPANYNARQWGPLRRRRMPDNTYRWLCEEHAKEYAN